MCSTVPGKGYKSNRAITVEGADVRKAPRQSRFEVANLVAGPGSQEEQVEAIPVDRRACCQDDVQLSSSVFG